MRAILGDNRRIDFSIKENDDSYIVLKDGKSLLHRYIFYLQNTFLNA